MAKLIFHHRALCKGYVCKECGYSEYYHGIYGIGVKKHIPNRVSSVSNTYHHVDYYLLDDEKFKVYLVLSQDRYATCPKGINEHRFNAIRQVMERKFRNEWMNTPDGLYTDEQIWRQTHRHFIDTLLKIVNTL